MTLLGVDFKFKLKDSYIVMQFITDDSSLQYPCRVEASIPIDSKEDKESIDRKILSLVREGVLHEVYENLWVGKERLIEPHE